MTRSRPRRSRSCPTSRGGCGSRSRWRRETATLARSPCPGRTRYRRGWREALVPTSGNPIRAADVEAAEAKVHQSAAARLSFPELGLRDIVLDPETRLATIPCRSIPAARPSAASPPTAISPSTRTMSGCSPGSAAATFTTGARSTTPEKMVSTRLFRTVGRAGADRRGRADGINMSTSWSARGRPRPHARRQYRLQHRRGAARGRRGNIATCPAGRGARFAAIGGT